METERQQPDAFETMIFDVDPSLIGRWMKVLEEAKSAEMAIAHSANFEERVFWCRKRSEKASEAMDIQRQIYSIIPRSIYDTAIDIAPFIKIPSNTISINVPKVKTREARKRNLQ